jgi:hypothetical protein
MWEAAVQDEGTGPPTHPRGDPGAFPRAGISHYNFKIYIWSPLDFGERVLAFPLTQP